MSALLMLFSCAPAPTPPLELPPLHEGASNCAPVERRNRLMAGGHSTLYRTAPVDDGRVLSIESTQGVVWNDTFLPHPEPGTVAGLWLVVDVAHSWVDHTWVRPRERQRWFIGLAAYGQAGGSTLVGGAVHAPMVLQSKHAEDQVLDVEGDAAVLAAVNADHTLAWHLAWASTSPPIAVALEDGGAVAVAVVDVERPPEFLHVDPNARAQVLFGVGPEGDTLWHEPLYAAFATSLVGGDEEIGFTIGLNTSGDVHLGGTQSGSVRYDGAGAEHAVARYHLDGTLQWVTRIIGAVGPGVRLLAVPGGATVVYGSSGAITVGFGRDSSESVAPAPGGGFVAWLEPDGSVRWVQTLRPWSTGRVGIGDIVWSDGELVMVGYQDDADGLLLGREGELVLAGNPGHQRRFLARLRPDGSWSCATQEPFRAVFAKGWALRAAAMSALPGGRTAVHRDFLPEGDWGDERYVASEFVIGPGPR